MFKHSSSTLGLCIALFLVFSITFSSFPTTRSGLVLAQASSAPHSAPTSDQQKGSVAPSSKAQPQKTPVPNSPQAVTITATKRDAFPGHADGAAHSGDTITYTVVVTNNGTTDATGVTFTDNVDVNTTTLVGGSPTLSAIAVADTYTAIGNVRINTANIVGLGQKVTDNDSLTNGATLSGFGASQATANGTVPNGTNTVTTANGATVLMNADGTFTFNPAPGYTGADSFFYAVTSPTTGTSTAQVTVTMSNLVWFINNSGANGDGRLTAPFSSIANYNASAPTKDPNDIVFIYTGTGTYTGNLTLVSGMQLIGQGVDLATVTAITAPPGSDALPGAVSNPSIDSAAGNTVTLGLNNTIRGLDLRNSAGIDLTGSAFGTLTVSVVGLTGTGRPLDLTNGTLAATFTGITSTSSSGGPGINLSSVGGNMTVTGGTSITNPTTQGILVTGSTANINFGNTTISGGTDGVSLQNNSAGARTFGTLSVGSNSGIGFLHANGGGNTTINGFAQFNSAGNNIDIQNMTAGTIVNFVSGANVTKTTTGGAGVNLATNTGATITFDSLDIATSNGTGLSATGGGAINVTNPVKSISATGIGAQTAPAIIANGVALNANFSSVSSNGSGTGGNGISLTNVTGTSNFGGGSLTGAAGATFLVNGSPGTVTYNGTITQGNAARVVDIQNKTGGTITLGGAVSSTGGTGTGIFLNNNGGATITFTGGVSLVTNANAAFTATGGGTVNATQDNTSIANTLSTTTGTALNVTNTTIGASGLTFRSISSNGAANGIFLNNTGASGGLTVTGNAGTCTFSTPTCTGGHIQNTVGSDNTTNGIGVYLNSTRNVSLSLMRIDNHPNFAIRGVTVTGFTLQSSVLDGANGTSVIADNDGVSQGEDTVRFANLTGSALIDSCFIGGGFMNNVRVVNNTGTLNRLTVSNCTIGDLDGAGAQRGLAPQASGGEDDVHFESKNGISVMNATISNNTLNYSVSNTVQASNNDNTNVAHTMDVVIRGNTMVNSNPIAGQVPGATNISVAGLGTTTYDVSCNKLQNSNSINLNVFKGGGSTGNFSGTIFNNTLGATGVVHSGGGAASSALNVDSQGSGTHTVLIKNNNVRRYGEAGIRVNNVDGNSTLNATIIGNTVLEPDSDAFAGLFVVGGADPATDNSDTTNLLVGGSGAARNDFTLGDPNDAGAGNDVFLQHSAGVMNLSRGVSASSSSSQIVIDNNISTGLTVATTDPGPPAIIPVNTVPTLPAAINESCSPPPIPNPGADIVSAGEPSVKTATARKVAQTANLTGSPFVSLPLQADSQADALRMFTPIAQLLVKRGNVLTGSLDNIAPQTETQQRENEGRTNSSISASAMQPINTAIRSSATESKAQVSRGATPIVPVKTASLQSASSRSRDVRLNHAVRRSSVSDTKRLAPASGGTVSIPIGTLSAGSSVTVTFQVTVDSAAPANASNVSNQGTVSGGNFASVLTDDPDTVAALDPTLTPLLHPTAANGIVSGRITTSDGAPVEGAVMTLSGTQSRKMITDANGNYRFDNVETSGFYTVTPTRANYNFNPFNRSFTQLENTTEAIFTATSMGDSVNPLDMPEYFVRQQYVDLLGREPEEDGFNYWSDRILECGGDTLCVNARRRDVAAAFFIEAEFQQTGSFIYGLYKGSLGRTPFYAEFSSDRQHVIGGPNLETMKQAFAESFIGRAEFVAKYQANMTAESFVNALLENVQQASGIDLSSQRDALTATYNTGANLNESRSLVVRELTESADFRQAEYNAAFVLTEYFGYLRRDAEPEGYNFWLDVLNNREPGNFRGMVCSFITSTEYQQRFSSIVSHGNQECGQ